MKIRLQKAIAEAGLASRRTAEEWIAEGKVFVNGKPVTLQGTMVDPATDKITVRGKPLPKVEERIYIMLNKPPGCVTTTSDDRNRPTVMDFVKKVRERVFPVGRLDFNTQGVLLFTNDGDLAEKLLDPKVGITRTYQVKVHLVPTEKSLARIRRGIRIDGAPTSPVQVEILRRSGNNAFLTMKLVEGKNHHVKKICDAVGHPAIRLKRTHFAFLGLEDLPLGRLRLLTPREVQALKRLADNRGKGKAC